MFGSKLKKIQRWKEKGRHDKLIRMLSDKDPSLQLAAIKALGTVEANDAAVNALIACMRAPNPEFRIHVVEALGNLGSPRAAEHIRYLLQNDENETVRKKAGEALKRLAG